MNWGGRTVAKLHSHLVNPAAEVGTNKRNRQIICAILRQTHDATDLYVVGTVAQVRSSQPGSREPDQQEAITQTRGSI
jgi:hypothetical protein